MVHARCSVQGTVVKQESRIARRWLVHYVSTEYRIIFASADRTADSKYGGESLFRYCCKKFYGRTIGTLSFQIAIFDDCMEAFHGRTSVKSSHQDANTHTHTHKENGSDEGAGRTLAYVSPLQPTLLALQISGT